MLAETYRTPPSQLLRIEDTYAAWCLDEAVADYIARLREGQRPRAADADKPEGNLELIRRLREEMSG